MTDAVPASPAPRSRGWSRTTGLCALVGASIGALIAGGLLVGFGTGTTSRTVVQHEPTLGNTRNTSVIAQPEDLRAILARVEPAVVAITTGGAATDLPGGSDQQGGGAGTGVVIDATGTILTNDHVVADAGGRIEVSFADGSFKQAKVLGADARVDLALVQVDTSAALPAVRLGDSNSLKVGDEAVAIGNALALQGGPSVTQGIVSGTGRQVPEENGEILYNMIQTDAAINPGNSGGPLVDTNGDVVGINTAIANPQEAQNVGFAIPIASAKSAIADLQRGASAPVPFLGVSTTMLTPASAQEIGAAVGQGALVQDLTSGSPADRAGIKVNDVIVQIGGTAVHTEDEVANAVRQHAVGDRVSVVLDRAGRRLSVDVTLGQRPTSAAG